MKKLFAPLLIAASLLAPSAQAGEAEIAQSLKKHPAIDEVSSISKTPYAGLYEVVIDGRLYYTDSKGKYLIEGNVIDIEKRVNLTEERRRALFAIDFDKLPLDIAVKRVKGDGSRRMAYFTDPNCGFCKKLEQELSKVNNVTLYLFMGPIFSPASEELVRNVRCAKDPVKAWDDLMLNKKRPAEAKCDAPTDKVMALARKMGVNGTPNLIFGNGAQVPGYMPAEELEKALDEARKK